MEPTGSQVMLDAWYSLVLLSCGYGFLFIGLLSENRLLFTAINLLTPTIH